MTKEAVTKVLRYKAEHIKAKIRPEFFAEVADMLEREPCEDTIRRADAIRVASGYCHPANIAKELAKLPPVQPKPKVGHWIYDGDQIICSKCHTAFGFISLKLVTNFCAECGADMRDEKE